MSNTVNYDEYCNSSDVVMSNAYHGDNNINCNDKMGHYNPSLNQRKHSLALSHQQQQHSGPPQNSDNYNSQNLCHQQHQQQVQQWSQNQHYPGPNPVSQQSNLWPRSAMRAQTNYGGHNNVQKNVNHQTSGMYNPQQYINNQTNMQANYVNTQQQMTPSDPNLGTVPTQGPLPTSGHVPQNHQVRIHDPRVTRTESKPQPDSWAVPARYKLVKVIGSGSYGKVCHALDKQTGQNVAIKKIKRIFEDLIDCKRLLREIAILRFLDDDRVVKLYDVCVPEDPHNFTELYLVLELCDSDFKKLFRLPEFLTETHVVTLLFNTLLGLKYVHSAGIYHRDLKPANCLVNRDCSVKVCDFGLSRPVHRNQNSSSEEVEGSASRLTGHVVTRWYRAPELILLQDDYTESIDVWSLGCIFAELLGMLSSNIPNSKDRCPLFQGHTCYPLSPCKDHHQENVNPQEGKDPNCTYQIYYSRGSRDQLNIIYNYLGTPAESEIQLLDKQDARRYVRCFKPREPANFATMSRFRGSSPDALSLLSKMLVLNPAKRITVDDALQHPLFHQLHNGTQTFRTAPAKIDLEFEHMSPLSEDQLRVFFLMEIKHFHPEMVIPEELLRKGGML